MHFLISTYNVDLCQTASCHLHMISWLLLMLLEVTHGARPTLPYPPL